MILSGVAQTIECTNELFYWFRIWSEADIIYIEHTSDRNHRAVDFIMIWMCSDWTIWSMEISADRNHRAVDFNIMFWWCHIKFCWIWSRCALNKPSSYGACESNDIAFQRAFTSFYTTDLELGLDPNQLRICDRKQMKSLCFDTI